MLNIVDTLITLLKENSINVELRSGNGKDYSDFLAEKISQKEHIFISYLGFTIDYFESGGLLQKNYSMYVKSSDIENLTDNILNIFFSNTTILTTQGEWLIMPATGAVNYDLGFDVMELSITLKQI